MPTALVTGASSGIGRCVVTRLLDSGWEVIGVARRAAEIPERATAVALDLSDPEAIAAAFDEAPLAGVRVDAFVHCAGYGDFAPLELTPLADAARQLQVNVLSAIGVLQEIVPGMRAAGSGRVVLVSSIASRFSSPMAGWYHASKATLESVADTLRLELAPFGIDVAVVQPGPVATPWHVGALAALRDRTAGTPYERMGAATAASHAKGQTSAMLGTVDSVADVIIDAMTSERPRPRYLVGRGSRIAVTLPRFLPTRTFDRLTAREFGLN